jgi:mRNA interferase RelE/StbE
VAMKRKNQKKLSHDEVKVMMRKAGKLWGKYKIEYSEGSVKELRKIQKNDVKKIIAKIELLSTEPFPSGYKKIKGKLKLWRVRVGDYRVIYSVEQENLYRHRENQAAKSLRQLIISPPNICNFKLWKQLYSAFWIFYLLFAGTILSFVHAWYGGLVRARISLSVVKRVLVFILNMMCIS